MSTLRPTLLVFTLGAAGEQRRHPLLSEKHASFEFELRQACLVRLLSAGQTTGCRTVVASARPMPGIDLIDGVTDQGQGDFASRLRQAMASIQTSAARPLIVVGTDIPDLGQRQIQATIDSLGEHPERVVVGPSPDGGLYLLASSFPLDEVLADIPWQRPDTRRRLLAALRFRGFEIVELEPLQDLDEPRDLEIWLASRPDSKTFAVLRRRLGLLLAVSKRAPWAEAPAPLLPLWVEAQSGRAPPA